MRSRMPAHLLRGRIHPSAGHKGSLGQNARGFPSRLVFLPCRRAADIKTSSCTQHPVAGTRREVLAPKGSQPCTSSARPTSVKSLLPIRIADTALRTIPPTRPVPGANLPRLKWVGPHAFKARYGAQLSLDRDSGVWPRPRHDQLMETTAEVAAGVEL